MLHANTIADFPKKKKLLNKVFQLKGPEYNMEGSYFGRFSNFYCFNHPKLNV